MTTKWHDTDQSAVYLREMHGLPVESKTLRNKRAQGTGPRWHYFGAKPLASTEDLDAYAETAMRLESPVRRNMRERAERRASTKESTTYTN